jgi:hypothetical protein
VGVVFVFEIGCVCFLWLWVFRLCGVVWGCFVVGVGVGVWFSVIWVIVGVVCGGLVCVW